MTTDFPTLRDDEIDILVQAPVMVAILMAGADDDIDVDEINGAINFTKNQKSDSDIILNSYFDELCRTFEENLSRHVKDLPKVLEHREHTCIAYLRQLNTILPKVDIAISRKFHTYLIDLAHAVATASGGVFGFNKISKVEAKFLDLKMIDNPEKYQYS